MYAHRNLPRNRFDPAHNHPTAYLHRRSAVDMQSQMQGQMPALGHLFKRATDASKQQRVANLLSLNTKRSGPGGQYGKYRKFV